MKTPCDYGECPYDAQYSEDCRYCCGLGVDEDEADYEAYEDDFYYENDCCGIDEDKALLGHLEGRMDMSRCYSPSAPWYAPGMSVKDFI